MAHDQTVAVGVGDNRDRTAVGKILIVFEQVNTRLQNRAAASAHFDPSGAACLRQVLEASLELVASGGEGSATFLLQFNGVYLLDSTEVSVPEAWASVGWR